MSKINDFEVLVEEGIIKFPDELCKIGSYFPTCNMNADLDHIIRQFKRMSKKYKYAYRCFEKLEEYSRKDGWKRTKRFGFYVFTNLRPDYEILLKAEEYPIELRPEKYDNKKLLKCLEEMKTTGLSTNIFEKIKNQLLDNEFEFNYIKEENHKNFIQSIIQKRDDVINKLYNNFDHEYGDFQYELKGKIEELHDNCKNEIEYWENEFKDNELIDQAIEDELKMRYSLYGEVYMKTTNSFIYFYKTNEFEDEDFENNFYRKDYQLKRCKIEDRFWREIESSYYNTFVETKDIRLKILQLKTFSRYLTYTELEEFKFLNKTQEWKQYEYNRSYEYKVPYSFKKLSYRDAEYKRIFNIYRKAGYSKWQVQQIMKKYLKLIDKWIKLEEELIYRFKNTHFEDSDELQVNNGYGYIGDGAEFDEDDVAVEIRNQHKHNLDMELEDIGWGLDEIENEFEDKFNSEIGDFKLTEDVDEDDDCPF